MEIPLFVKFNTSDFFRSLLLLPKTCVIVFRNDERKEFYVTPSIGVLRSIERLLERFNDGSFELLLYYPDSDPLLLPVLSTQIYDNLIKEGYKSINKRLPVRYKVRIVEYARVRFLEYNVVLVSSRNSKKLIKSFRSFEKADKYVKAHTVIEMLQYSASRVAKQRRSY